MCEEGRAKVCEEGGAKVWEEGGAKVWEEAIKIIVSLQRIYDLTQYSIGFERTGIGLHKRCMHVCVCYIIYTHVYGQGNPIQTYIRMIIVQQHVRTYRSCMHNAHR